MVFFLSLGRIRIRIKINGSETLVLSGSGSVPCVRIRNEGAYCQLLRSHELSFCTNMFVFAGKEIQLSALPTTLKANQRAAEIKTELVKVGFLTMLYYLFTRDGISGPDNDRS